MTTFKIWPRDWPYIIPTNFHKISVALQEIQTSQIFSTPYWPKFAKFSSSLPSLMAPKDVKFGVNNL